LTARQRAKIQRSLDEKELSISELEEKDRLKQVSYMCQMLGIKEEHIAQDPTELQQVIDRLEILRPKRTLEIGVKYGGTSRVWQLVTSDLVVAIDLDTSKIAVDFSGYTPPLIIQGDSTDPETIAKAREQGPYDFLFIDGGHDFETAKSDWNNYAPMVRPGGLVGIHDVGAAGTGPEVLVRNIREDLGLHCEVFAGHKGTALVSIPNV